MSGRPHSTISSDDQKKINALLFEAVKANDFDKVIEHLGNGANVNSISNGRTPLHEATRSNRHYDQNIDVVRTLIAAGADINARTSYDGSTPLINAIVSHKTDVAKVLINAGADVNASDKSSSTPLSWAGYRGNENLIKSLIAAGANVNSQTLLRAAQHGHTDLVSSIITAGVCVNSTDNRGFTPLHMAALNEKTSSVKLLIAAGANIRAADKEGSTPLHKATKHGHIDIVKLLITAGVDVNIADVYGSTPLHDAVFYSFNNDLVIASLIAAGADINLHNNAGNTALQILEASIRNAIDVDDIPKLRESIAIIKAANYSDNIVKWYKSEIKVPGALPEGFTSEHYDLMTLRIKAAFHKDGIPPKFLEMSSRSSTSAINKIEKGEPIIPPDIKNVLQSFAKEVKKEFDKSPDNIEIILATILPSLIAGKQCLGAAIAIYKEGEKTPRQHLEENQTIINALKAKPDNELYVDESEEHISIVDKKAPLTALEKRALLEAESMMLLHDSSQWPNEAAQYQAYKDFTGASDDEARSHNLTMEGLLNAVISGVDLPKIPHESASLPSFETIKDNITKAFGKDEVMALNSCLKKAMEGYYAQDVTYLNIENLARIVEPVATSMSESYAADHKKVASPAEAGAGAGVSGDEYDASHSGHALSEASSARAQSPAHGGAGRSPHDEDSDVAVMGSSHHSLD